MTLVIMGLGDSIQRLLMTLSVFIYKFYECLYNSIFLLWEELYLGGNDNCNLCSASEVSYLGEKRNDDWYLILYLLILLPPKRQRNMPGSVRRCRHGGRGHRARQALGRQAASQQWQKS